MTCIQEAAITRRSHTVRPFRALTTLQTVLVALVGAAIGVGVIVFANTWDWLANRLGLQAVLNNLGGAIFVAFALTVLWELFGKRAFAREILESVRLNADVESAGIARVGVDYLQDPEWEDLFRDTEKLDIFFSYGRTWRNTHRKHLDELAQRPHGRIRVVLPDPNDSETVQNLAQRFGMESAELVANIKEACADFQSLGEPNGAKIEVYYRPGEALFTYYRLDKRAVVVLYSHKRQRIYQVPTVVCHSGGSLYDFLRTDFEAIIRQGYPEGGESPSPPGTSDD